jgi:acyl-coenzyme A synthetase/AMP-(fatty) acid ligase/acyl carrier protein
LTADDRVLQFASISFDVAAEEIFSALLSGASIFLPSEKVIESVELLRLIEDQKLSVLNLPAPFWHAWVRELTATNRVPRCLRLLVVGSEKVSLEAFDAWRRLASGARLINAYGTSETTITSTLYEPEGSAPAAGIGASLPIGRPIANTRVYILDRHLQPVPTGVPGELYIGGTGLARGYLMRPALTADRFIPDPFSLEAGARMYRTGDRARFLSEGQIEFLGRSDQQLKVRGYRIEPGEIEFALKRHPAVREALVLAREDSTGDKRLVAYMTLDRETEEGQLGLLPQLRNTLEDQLPDYMMPSSFVLLDKWPLTPGGKIDLHALPAPDSARSQEHGAVVAPRTPVEETLASIWSELLGLARIGIHDNFFESGGHSMLATQLISRVREKFQVEIALRQLFERPTIESFATVVEEAQHHSAEPQIPEIVPIARQAHRVKRSAIRRV